MERYKTKWLLWFASAGDYDHSDIKPKFFNGEKEGALPCLNCVRLPRMPRCWLSPISFWNISWWKAWHLNKEIYIHVVRPAWWYRDEETKDNVCVTEVNKIIRFTRSFRKKNRIDKRKWDIKNFWISIIFTTVCTLHSCNIWYIDRYAWLTIKIFRAGVGLVYSVPLYIGLFFCLFVCFSHLYNLGKMSLRISDC